MYRIILVASLLLLISFTCFTGEARASKLHQEDGIYPNHSAEYVRTLNRNASTDADAAFYNPAGLIFMKKNGLYAMFSSQTYYARRVHTMDYYAIKYDTNSYEQTFHTRDDFITNLPDEYYAETTAPILPDFDIIYKEDMWAAYFDISVMQAAPGMYFPEGLAIMEWGNLAGYETTLAGTPGSIFNAYTRRAEATRTEYYIGFTAGGAYKILDWISAALAIRYIDARGNMNIKVKDISYTIDGITNYSPSNELWNIDVDTKGRGFGVIVGSHFKFYPPGTSGRKALDVGFRYEYYFPLEMKKTTNSLLAPRVVEASGNLDIFKDGTDGEDMVYEHGNGESSLKVTYPQTISIGASYYILKRLRAEVSGEISLRQYRDLDGREDDYKLGYRYGLCVEWTIFPEMKASAGYLYNDFGIKSENRDEADPLLTSHTLGGGLGINVNDRTDLSVGFFYMIFVPEKVNTVYYTDVTDPTWHATSKEFDEKRYSVAIGITYRIADSFFGSGSGLSRDKKLILDEPE